MNQLLYLLVLAQAVDDILVIDLGCSISESDDEDQEIYEEALLFVSRYGKIKKRLRKKEAFKWRWLYQIREAKEECLRKYMSNAKGTLALSLERQLRASRNPLTKCLLQ
jgi:hypothetical protein